MIRQLDGLHLYPELLQLLDSRLYLEDSGLLLYSRQEEATLDVKKFDLQVEPLLVYI